MNKRNIYIMYAIALLQGMVFYGPVASLYRQAHGVSILQITVIESISLILCLILEFPWGIIADRIGYKRTIVFCCALYFLSKIVFWQADDFFAFLAERIMLSVVIAGLSGVDTGFLYLSCEEGKSQKIFGIYNSLGTAGLLIAALVFSMAAGNDYQLAGLLTVVSYGAAAILALGLQEVNISGERKPDARSILLLLKETGKERRLLLFLLGVALLGESHQTITVFLNQLQYVKCGLSPTVIGYIYIVVTIAGLCSVWSAALTKKIGERRTVLVLYGASTLACGLLAFTDNAWISIGGILALRIAYSLFQPLQTEMQNRQVKTQNRATALSMNAVVIDSVGAGTNVVFGGLAEKNLSRTFLFGAVLCATGGILVICCGRYLRLGCDRRRSGEMADRIE